ncbi:V-type ATP synthase subunit D [Streptomyces sp. NPDC020801]|uniref:V-type ATP synthase subunit D n=1 Tax=unclassified Streptomyces TaxID=2593676 RepID=UPI0037883BB6
MSARQRLSPGRAARLRLRRRLAAAERGADLLERKLRLLLERRTALEDAARVAGKRWREEIAAAEEWLLRGLVIGGEQALTEAVPARPGTLEVQWSALMGLRHPTGVTWSAPVREPGEALAPNTALAHAETEYRTAVRTGAEYAAARTAAELVAAEALRTRQRVRALRRHWIPRLTQELAAADQALEQAEHEEAVRRRWAARNATHGG